MPDVTHTTNGIYQAMTSFKSGLTAAGIFLLSSCAAKWTHSYKNEQDFNSDLATCRYLAVQTAQSYAAPMSDAWPATMDNYAGAWNASNTETVKAHKVGHVVNCMIDRGWRKQARPGEPWDPE